MLNVRPLFLVIIFLLGTISGAGAGRGGGHVTKFDANLYGGGWTTINCVGNLTTDMAAFNSWITAAKAANPAKTPLRLTGECVTDGTAIFDSINNVLIWGYGASIDDIIVGPLGGFTLFTPLFTNDANIGDTSITLKTVGDAVNFTVGQYFIMTGLEVQYPDCGSPPNTQFFDFALVTAKAGAVITFSPPLTNNYKAAWPLVCGDGPAAAMTLGPNWQTKIEIFGLTFRSTAIDVIRGKTVNFVDCVWQRNGTNANVSPTTADSITFSNSFVPITEVDKLIGSMSFNNVSGNPYNWHVQSGSIKQWTIANSSANNLVGTALNTTITNSSFSNLQAGPQGYGSAKTLYLDGVTAPMASAGYSNVLSSAPTYSSGTFTMALTNPNIGSFAHAAVPGFKYVLGDNKCPNCGSPIISFTITNVRVDATNYYWDTDLLSAPSAVCGGFPCPYYESWGAQTIIQINTPAGSANVKQWAAP